MSLKAAAGLSLEKCPNIESDSLLTRMLTSDQKYSGSILKSVNFLEIYVLVKSACVRRLKGVLNMSAKLCVIYCVHICGSTDQAEEYKVS